MKLSRGRMSRVLMGMGVAAATFVMSGVAMAAEIMGQPQEWEYKLQKAATPIMENIIWFHNFLLWLITAIVLFVQPEGFDPRDTEAGDLWRQAAAIPGVHLFRDAAGREARRGRCAMRRVNGPHWSAAAKQPGGTLAC